MLRSIRARLQRVEEKARREPAFIGPPIEFVNKRDFDSEEAFEARVAEITGQYPPDHEGPRVVIIDPIEPLAYTEAGFPIYEEEKTP